MAQSQLHPGRALALVALLVLGVVLWETPAVLPLKLLAVMGHETGHAMASLLVGGSVDQVTLRADESGACLSRIPDGFLSRVIVYSAGYVGSVLIAVALLLASFRFNARRVMLGLGAAWLLAMGVFYARDLFTLVFCIGMGGLFALGARFLPAEAVGLTNLTFASFTALYAVMDLKDDLWNGAVRSRSDAQLLADLTIVPAGVWAVVWTLVSLAIMAWGVKLALSRGPVVVTRRPGRGPVRVGS